MKSEKMRTVHMQMVRIYILQEMRRPIGLLRHIHIKIVFWDILVRKRMWRDFLCGEF